MTDASITVLREKQSLSKCMTDYSSEKDIEYASNRIWEFLETDKEDLQ